MSLLHSTHFLVSTHSGRWGLGVWLCSAVPTHYRLYSMAIYVYDSMFYENFSPSPPDYGTLTLENVYESYMKRSGK